MPYRECPRCRLTTYSAARYSSVDECPRCHAPLAAKPRRLFSAVERPLEKVEPSRNGHPQIV
jgi:hypothetical protein